MAWPLREELFFAASLSKSLVLGIIRDFLGLLPGHRGRDPVRGWVRHRPRLHSLVLRDGAVHAVRPADRLLHRRRGQLVC